MVGCVLTDPPSLAALITTNKPEIHAEVIRVLEIRETKEINSKCHISLKFTADRLAGKQGILKVRAIRAFDDVGTDLISSDTRTQMGGGVNDGHSFAALRGWHDERAWSTRFVNVELRNSSRSARTIAILEGELELYSPTIQNGAVALVENFCAQPGVEFGSVALKKLNVKLSYVTKESCESVKTSSQANSRPGRRLFSLNDTDSLFFGFLGGATNTPGNYVVLKIDDPQQKVIGFAFREPSGRFLPVRQQRSANGMRGFYFDPFVPKKLDLFVYLDVPEAVEKVPFRIENIRLP
jgi:hypothetical protein